MTEEQENRMYMYTYKLIFFLDEISKSERKTCGQTN